MKFSKKAMIVATSAAALTLAASAYAATPGYYAGVKVGYSNSHFRYTSALLNVHSNDTGFAYGIDGGYNFNKNFGIEVGANRYHNTKIKVDGVNDSAFKYYDVDVLGTAYIPVNSFDLFTKAGLAYVHGNGTSNYLTNDQLKLVTANHNWIRPKVVLGADYHINQHLITNISYSRVFGEGNAKSNSKYLPDLDMAAVGIDYSF